jgi:hypothetical protein
VLTVACVYTPGGGFTDEYVYRLQAAVAKHLALSYEFVCYTDQRLHGVNIRPLAPDLQGWFNKFSLWLTPSQGDILYFDLDTIILGDITQFASVGKTTLLNDLGRRLTEWRLQSGMMYLTQDSRDMLRQRHEPAAFSAGGDGQWMHNVLGKNCARWQDRFPGQICSYKYDVCHKWGGSIPADIRVVCFHGKPRPHEVDWSPYRVWTNKFEVINMSGRSIAGTSPDAIGPQRWEEVLKRLPPGPILGAEIGVNIGRMSAKLLERPDLTLYMVDAYSERLQGHMEPGRSRLFAQTMYDKNYETAKRATAFAGDRARMVRAPSVQVAGAIVGSPFDFVFIDADHTYEGCRADILAWGPKVKSGGLLCGHDYDFGVEPAQFPGVRRAVDELLTGVTFGGDGCWFVTRA